MEIPTSGWPKKAYDAMLACDKDEFDYAMTRYCIRFGEANANKLAFDLLDIMPDEVKQWWLADDHTLPSGRGDRGQEFQSSHRGNRCRTEAKLVGNLVHFPGLNEAADRAVGDHNVTTRRKLLDRFDRFSVHSAALEEEDLKAAAVALEATLALLSEHSGFAAFVAEQDLSLGLDMSRGWVPADVYFLAIIEAGHFLWCMSNSRMSEYHENGLADLIKLPPGFGDDIKDIAGAVMAWSSDPARDENK